MTATTRQPAVAEQITEYSQNRDGFREYLFDKADELFPFPGYREYQDEILRKSLETLFIEGYSNVIIQGPTGIGKSPVNVTIARVITHLSRNKQELEDYFNFFLHGIEEGKTFYTTPQKQLRNQLAQDDDLRDNLKMLKSRRDYICGASGDNCDECTLAMETEDGSCRTIADCTYWNAKRQAMKSNITALTFAMQVVDNHIPVHLESEGIGGEQISFDDRDGEIVDEGHGLEGQVASLFAGFSVSPFVLPDEVYKGTSARIEWDFERFEDISSILTTLEHRAEDYIEQYEEDPNKQHRVDQCENFLRKVNYCRAEVKEGRPWVVTVDTVGGKNNKQKKATVKPVDVDKFLQRFIWSRGNKRIISSATIPYRDNIGKWADRIGLDGSSTKLISRPMPFPEEHRLIHTNTMVASMSGDGEDNNWREVVSQIEEIAGHHEGENGLIHTASYQRAEKLADALGRENVIVQDREKEKDVMIHEWDQSDKDILLSPSMTEGVDLHGDLCRWQVLMKVPYPYVGDSRVSYLLNERGDWDWYMETASLDVQQSVGRAVRGPEPEEAASYYVIDKAFDKVMSRTSPPDWFMEAVRHEAPEHWENPDAAPWR